MEGRIYDIYEAIINNTDSVLIVFLIVLTLGIIIAIIPLYNLMLKGRKAHKAHELERDGLLIDVVKGSSAAIAENSAVISGLKTTLEHNNAAFVKALDRVHARIDEQGAAAAETAKSIFSEMAQINTKISSFIATSLENQRETSSKIDKILILVSGGKLPDEGKG